MKCSGIAFLIVSMTCETEAPKVIDSFCQRAQIITVAREDTAETKRQVLRHNEKVRRCPAPRIRQGEAPAAVEAERSGGTPASTKRNFSRYALPERAPE